MRTVAICPTLVVSRSSKLLRRQVEILTLSEMKSPIAVLMYFGQCINDAMGTGPGRGDELRERHLAPLVECMVGSRATLDVEERRVALLVEAAQGFAAQALHSAQQIAARTATLKENLFKEDEISAREAEVATLSAQRAVAKSGTEAAFWAAWTAKAAARAGADIWADATDALRRAIDVK